MTNRSIAIILLAALVLAPAAHAEPPKPAEPGPWKFGALTSFNLAQSSFSTNWKGGDKGSIVWVLGADLAAERQFSPRYNLQNTLRAAYGQTTRQTADPADARHYVWIPPTRPPTCWRSSRTAAGR